MKRSLLFVFLCCINLSLFAQWQFTGLANRTVKSITSVGNTLFAGTDNKIYTSTDDGANWTTITNPSQFFYQFFVENNNGVLVASAYDDGTYNSTDNGLTWQMKSQVPNQFNFFKLINGSLYAGTLQAIFRSNNNGLSWDQLNTSLFFDCRGASVNGSDIWAASYSSGLYHSSDNGSTWENIANGLPSLHYSDIICVGNVILAATKDDNGIMRSTDNGATWTKITDDWSVSNFYAYGGNIFAFKVGMGSTRGPVRSTDNGLTWTYINEGLQFNPGVFYQYKSYMFAGMEVGQGAFRRNLSDWGLSGVKELTGIPNSAELFNNYPNPFNPTTKIKFSIKERSNVSLKIFNTLGEQIAILVNQELQAGSYETDFNASNLPGGIYFYTLNTGSTSLTKKMTLMK